jgi:hypothetical protein
LALNFGNRFQVSGVRFQVWRFLAPKFKPALIVFDY